MVWGRSAARSRGINAVGKQSEGSVLRVAEDRTLTGRDDVTFARPREQGFNLRQAFNLRHNSGRQRYEPAR
ncbi:hypothetical protein NQZ68_026483 [Dissostichus eleginoides]|nr:hypothetical protein NQZ68_026483 [Dissostichus eleginoides]